MSKNKPTLSLSFFRLEKSDKVTLPDYGYVKAGFPSPAEDFTENHIDLNKALIKNKETTFVVRVHGDSMKNAGIGDGDLLLVDKSIEAQDNQIAVCFVDGEFTVKRIKKDKDCMWLLAENESYPPIKVEEGQELMVWGVVTNVIKSF